MTKKVKSAPAETEGKSAAAERPEPGQPGATGSEVPPAGAPETAPGADEVGAPSTEAGATDGDAAAEATGDPAETGPEAADEDAQAAHVAALEAEVAGLKDRLLRALAELENTRRRAERDRKDAETYGGTRLARDLLAVHDNLTRALAAADDELRQQHGAFIEGVELTQRELLNAFGKHRIALVSPERGEKFDPNRHQAMFEAPVPGAPNGSVIEVMQPGFTIADRLLRPAMVGVARGGEAKAPAEAEAKPEEPAAASGGGQGTGA